MAAGMGGMPKPQKAECCASNAAPPAQTGEPQSASVVIGCIAGGTLRVSSRCAHMSTDRRAGALLVPASAILLTALALIAPAAHLFVLPNKIGMAENEYFIAQSIYAGWWMIGLFLPAAFIANLGLAYTTRHDRMRFWLAIGAAGLIALNLAIFALWTQPANAATSNWTIRPENWRSLRTQWEYSHALNAGVIFLALCATTVAALRTR
jgi:hypothetical protein